MIVSKLLTLYPQQADKLRFCTRRADIIKTSQIAILFVTLQKVNCHLKKPNGLLSDEILFMSLL